MVSRAISDSETGLFGSAPYSADPTGLPGRDRGAGSPRYATVKTGLFGSAGAKRR